MKKQKTLEREKVKSGIQKLQRETKTLGVDRVVYKDIRREKPWKNKVRIEIIKTLERKVRIQKASRKKWS